MELYKKIIEVFSITGEIHSSLQFLSNNEIMLLVSKRNEVLRSIGFINGSIILNNNEIEIFEEPSDSVMENNSNLIMAVIAPFLCDIIANKGKEYPDFMFIVNASGRLNFLKGLVSLVHTNALIFDKLDTFIKSESLIQKIKELKKRV